MRLRHEVRGRNSRAWWRTVLWGNPSWRAILSFAQLEPTHTFVSLRSWDNLQEAEDWCVHIHCREFIRHLGSRVMDISSMKQKRDILTKPAGETLSPLHNPLLASVSSPHHNKLQTEQSEWSSLLITNTYLLRTVHRHTVSISSSETRKTVTSTLCQNWDKQEPLRSGVPVHPPRSCL